MEDHGEEASAGRDGRVFPRRDPRTNIPRSPPLNSSDPGSVDAQGPSLETHLRRLIPTNANGSNDADESHFPPLPQSAPPQTSTGPSGNADRRDMIATKDAKSQAESASVSQKGTRRRPNQAQRRQMSSQLSLSVDTRETVPPALASAPYSAFSPGGSHHVTHDRQHSSPATDAHQQRQNWPQSPAMHNPPPSMPWFSMSSADATRPRHGANHYNHGHGRRATQSAGSVPSLYDNASRPRFPNQVLPYHHHNHRTQYQQHEQPQHQHHQHQYQRSVEVLFRQASMLDQLCSGVVAAAEIERDEIAEKEGFRILIQDICRRAISDYEHRSNNNSTFDQSSVQLKCFGSLSSGFATKASDMDLGLLSPNSTSQPDDPGSAVPRLVEKAFLDAGLGARLLSRTRVPIIKLCEKPSDLLLASLRRERERWERGTEAGHGDAADDEDNDGYEEEHDENGSNLRKHVALVSTTVPRTGKASGDKTGSAPKDGNAYRESVVKAANGDRSLLKQGENQSLASFYKSANRMLRKLGGRDLTLSNQSKFSDEDYTRLFAVCRAFVGGLHDMALRDRLASYSTLQFDQSFDAAHARTLIGVFTQIEGEAMLLQWETRPFCERSDESERQLNLLVESWKLMQDRPTTVQEALHHSKELQGVLEKMKRARSVQLILLEQGQFETANSYHDRTLKIRVDIRPKPGFTEHHVEELVVRHYLSGLFYRDIRQSTRELASCELASLDDIVVRHKSLQLAMELERAQAHKLYPVEASKAITAYIGILRAPLKTVTNARGQSRLVVPIDEANAEHVGILGEIRRLSDPALLAPNQPRDPYRDKLEFPKDGVGVQCDINFSAHLALQNTLLLRCYSHTDPRVRPFVLFVKHWAKVRAINTPYRGTLSSYGYVLMVLHFLVNVAQPFVCPNLQQLGYAHQPLDRPPDRLLATSGDGLDETVFCKGRDVRFWRDEDAIARLAACGDVNKNTAAIGSLLCAFFEYYAHYGALSTLHARGFDWGREVLSLRTPGGLLTKQEKGWTGARTVTVVEPASATAMPAPQKGTEVKEVRHRYLFAIEDPFETDHNVARTVTHNGIVAIRDEFRRAWRIIQNTGHPQRHHEDLLEQVKLEHAKSSGHAFLRTIDELQGKGFAAAPQG